MLYVWLILGSKRYLTPYYCTNFADKEMKSRESEKSPELLLLIISSFLYYYAFSVCLQMFLEVKTGRLPHMHSLSHTVSEHLIVEVSLYFH